MMGFWYQNLVSASTKSCKCSRVEWGLVVQDQTWDYIIKLT